MVFDILYRIYYGFLNPPTAKKHEDVIRFGLLSASNIAPIALIAPAKCHPETIVAAVAARDKSRAEAYAKKHGIPIVHSNYEDLLNDPSIDAIYISLPNAHHYEWAIKALRAKKHVLLEKPPCSNATEAHSLFAYAKNNKDTILLEAFHTHFHPAWQTFMSLVHDSSNAGKIRSASAAQYLPKYGFGATDIRWRFDLAGGCMMDFGTYPMSILRNVLREEPQAENLSAKARTVEFASIMKREEVDEAMEVKFKTKSGAIGNIFADLRTSCQWKFPPQVLRGYIPSFGLPKCEVECLEREVESPESRGEVAGSIDSGRCFVKRKVTFWNYLMPSIYHRIDVEDEYVVRGDAGILKSWKDVQHLNAYTWPKGDIRGTGIEKAWWTSYSYQLEEFVNRIKRRKGSGVWVDGEESMKQMEAIDLVYNKAGMSVRPSTGFQV
ncbi:hypothetical protein N7456_006634 [Penicillium angulare]|uniref:D-xylose 1-dehydrogenase (NADP(+), D-xylono-1,5-lactone-forming) n=1 Tax=Penicillium angulare TaxID=116970 RepID=A0A9W9FIG9_9EURO|nr:hypothetical protein N7456_006634 [Penicillium angulare]